MAARAFLTSDMRAADDTTTKSTRSRSKKLAAGACSGMISALAFQPLDVLRTHQQGAFGSAPTVARTGVSAVVPRTLLAAAADQPALTARVRSMWRGTSSTLLRVAGGAGLYFATLDHCMSLFPNTAANTFLAGAFARTFAGCVMSPLTIIKARMEWQAPGTFTTNRAVFQHVLREEGVRGLYRGMVPTLVRDVPFSGLYVLLYTRLKRVLEFEFPQSPTFVLHFSSGVIAGVLATSVVHPADVIKTRMQLTIMAQDADGHVRHVRNSMTLRQTVAKIFHGEGWKGFTKGIVPRVIKRTLSTAVTWTIYEQLSLQR